MNSVIQFNRFNCRLGMRLVLRDISLSIEEGAFVSILGPNGSGKSTLIKCALGIVRGESGEIRLMEKPLSKLSCRDIAKAAAYVPQTSMVGHPFTVWEFVRLSRFVHELPLSKPKKDPDLPVREALSSVGLSSFSSRSMETLSGGERQKALIAAALAQETPIILLDEPSAFLDYRCAEEIGEILTDINRDRGRTIVIVTHDINRAVAESSRIIGLSNGQVAFDGPPSHFTNKEVLESLFNTRFVLTKHPIADRMTVLSSGRR